MPILPISALSNRRGRLLDACRVVRARLQKLEVPQRTSLAVQNWGTQPVNNQLLWVNLPGKRATHCNDPMAHLTNFPSDVVSPLSEQSLTFPGHGVTCEICQY